MTSFPTSPMLERAVSFGYKVSCNLDFLTEVERLELKDHNLTADDSFELNVDIPKPEFVVLQRVLDMTQHVPIVALLRRGYEVLDFTVRDVEDILRLSKKISEKDNKEIGVQHYAEAIQYVQMNVQYRTRGF